MEEISGCDSASSNAIQAKLACPRQFLTPVTLPVGLGRPRPDTSLSHEEGMGKGGDSCRSPWAGAKGRGTSSETRRPTSEPLCLSPAVSSACPTLGVLC